MSPLDACPSERDEDFGEVEYLLRRADHEAVAALRATDPRAVDSHAVLARHYGQQSRDLMARLDRRAVDGK